MSLRLSASLRECVDGNIPYLLITNIITVFFLFFRIFLTGVGLFGQGNAATVKGRCVVHVATEGGGEEGNDGDELCAVDYEFECSGAQEVEYVDFDEPTVSV